MVLLQSAEWSDHPYILLSVINLKLKAGESKLKEKKMKRSAQMQRGEEEEEAGILPTKYFETK